MDLQGKVALVTGARRGLGRAVAQALQAAGAQVAAHTRAEGEFAADLADSAAPKALVERVLARFGRLDFLVNNAAYTPLGPLAAGLEFDLPLYEKVMAVNLRAPLQLALAAAQTGSLQAVVNVGSGSAQRGSGSSAYFVLSKGGYSAFTQLLARRLAPKVRVNCFLPGLIATEEIAERGVDFAPRQQSIIERTPMRRLGRPEEAAETILFLLAGHTFITGQSLMLDGGWHL